MDEGDLEAEEALSGLGVDQLGACGGEPVELGLHVVDLVRDVVHTRPALGEKPADGCLVAERREQLDAPLADEHGGGFDTLVRDVGPMLDLGAEQALVRLDGRVEVVNGDAEMVDAAGPHGSDAIEALVLESAHGAYSLGGPRLGLDRAEQSLQLVAGQCLALEQLARQPVE